MSLTPADIKIAALQEAITICETVGQTYGPMPQTACRSIVQALRERIADVVDREVHRKTVEAMA